MHTSFWLTDVRLENGYETQNGEVTRTLTSLYDIRIEEGNIAEIIQAGAEKSQALPKIDAQGKLLLPSFVEKHVHLDKTLLGEPWRAPLPATGVLERCEQEKRIIPYVHTPAHERAQRLLSILLNAGSTHVRTHVDLYPESGLSLLEGIMEGIQSYQGKLSAEVVAFPQHGLLHTGAAKLIRESLKQGATLVGGVDPATIDGDIEKSLQTIVELAVEGGAGIDLHLHDPDYLGTFTMKRLAALTMEAGLQGKVAISHAFALGEVSELELAATSEKLAEAGITIITSAPLSRTLPPIPYLRNHGVNVAAGCDNIYDSWQPYGNGDVLERATRIAERFSWIDEHSLSQALGLITGGVTPLSTTGQQAWPKAGDEASMVLVEASCTAEAIARRSKRTDVFFKGVRVAGEDAKTNSEEGALS